MKDEPIELLRKVKSRIEDCPETSILQLTNCLSISRSTLDRKMKRAVHKTASAYIRQLKMEIAHKKLKETGFSIAAVAYSLGYNSPSHFYQDFKKEYGYTPKSIRKNKS